MTGRTSGIGARAAAQLGRTADVRLILGVRRPSRVGETAPLDLTALDSVRGFASAVHGRLGGAPIDALVLNAGIIRPDANGRTVDGFETTFAVNHLAHYLLIRLMLPMLAEDAVVVLTTSGTHDPAQRAGLEPPRHACADLPADPIRDESRHRNARKAGEHAYTASKLCALLTATALRQRRSLTAVAYCPGQVFGTALTQHLPIHMRAAWKILGTPLGAPLRALRPALNARNAAGAALAALALGRTAPPEGRIYAALRGGRVSWPDPSALAQNDGLADRLWNDSASLVGLPA